MNNYKKLRTLRDTKYELARSNLDPTKLIILSVVLILISILMAIQIHQSEVRYDALIEGGYYTYGEITDVNTQTFTTPRKSGPRKSKTYHYIRGHYTVDEQTYKFYFRSDYHMREGDPVKIFYNQNNPSDYVTLKIDEGSNMIYSIIYILLSFAVFIFGIKLHLDKKLLKATGM